MGELHFGYVLILGMAGGLLNHMYLHENTILMPRISGPGSGRILAPGFIADLILGMGGAFVGLYLLVGTGAPFIRQVAVALMGGFGGGSLLARGAVELETERIRIRTMATEKTAVDHPASAYRSGWSAEVVRRIDHASSIYELKMIRSELDSGSAGISRPGFPKGRDSAGQ